MGNSNVYEVEYYFDCSSCLKQFSPEQNENTSNNSHNEHKNFVVSIFISSEITAASVL